MIYLRRLGLRHMLGHAKLPQHLVATLAATRDTVWTPVVVMADDQSPVEKCKLYRTLKDECDDKEKQRSLLIMATALHTALAHEDYQDALKGLSGISVKEAHSFKYRSGGHRIWELKHNNKNRVYFFTHRQSGVNYFVVFGFHHKKDQKTPKDICIAAASMMEPFLDPKPIIRLIEETA